MKYDRTIYMRNKILFIDDENNICLSEIGEDTIKIKLKHFIPYDLYVPRDEIDSQYEDTIGFVRCYDNSSLRYSYGGCDYLKLFMLNLKTLQYKDLDVHVDMDLEFNKVIKLYMKDHPSYIQNNIEYPPYKILQLQVNKLIPLPYFRSYVEEFDKINT